MPTPYEFRYDKQFQKAIGQFMRVFSGFQVQDGVDRGGGNLTKRATVAYATVDRAVADLIGKRKYFSATSIPLMVVDLLSYEIDKEEHIPKYHADSFGTERTPTEAMTRIMGPLINMRLSLSILASSRDELFQLVEQILLIFNPKVTVNVDDNLSNPNYRTEIILEDIQRETVYPISTEAEFPSVTMNFVMPMRLEYPHEYRDSIITQIIQNIKDMDSGEILLQEIING